MILWRISRHRNLSGAGGLKAAGRWHHPGRPVVYLAQNPSAALLEICVHTAASDIPPQFTLLKIEGPNLKVKSIGPRDLPRDWCTRSDVTRDIGTEWLRTNRGVLLRIPSALVPETANFLFNPLHGDAARFRVTEVFSYPFDMRLKS